MITSKAIKLARQIKPATNLEEMLEAKRLSRLAFEELFANCRPTRSEFIEFADGIILSASSLWELILRVPEWQRGADGNLERLL